MLIGNLGGAVESRDANGTPVCNFSLATNETYQNKQGQKVTDTQWHRITAWRGLAEIAAKYLRKGSKVFVQGTLKYGKYTDKEGIERYSTEIVISELTMLDPAPSAVPAGEDGNPEGYVPINQR
jgi:single-strand DNA-binding protein